MSDHQIVAQDRIDEQKHHVWDPAPGWERQEAFLFSDQTDKGNRVHNDDRQHRQHHKGVVAECLPKVQVQECGNGARTAAKRTIQKAKIVQHTAADKARKSACDLTVEGKKQKNGIRVTGRIFSARMI